MARRRHRSQGLNHSGTMGNPFNSRVPGQGSIRQGTHPVEAKKTLAERGLEERNSASRLLEGETFVGGDGYRYTVVSTFPDGSIRVRRSDGALGSLRPSDSVKLVSESPMREFVA